MKSCRVIATGRIIEAQSDATPGTLIANAISAGFAENDVEEIDMSDAALAEAFAAQEAARPKTDSDVLAERGRRLALGFDFDFGDARGVHRIGTTEADMRGWDEVTKLASAMLSVGSMSTIAIVTDTGPAEVTPTEWQDVLIAAGAFRQPIWAASFVLQIQSPIPDEYADDAHWPANTGGA